MEVCHLQILQLFPRNKRTTVCLSLTNPTVVPAQQENRWFSCHLQPYSRSVVPTQFSSVPSKPSAFANPVQISSVQFSCKFGDSSFLLQLLPRSRKTLILFATYKPYSQSVVPTQFSSVQTMRICKTCSVQFCCKFWDSSFLLQLLPRNRKT